MDANKIGTIVILVLIIIIIACVAYGIYRLKRAVRSFSRRAFGTESLQKGIDKMEREYSQTPKSVSAMTSLYLPKIKKDFPEFHYDEIKVRAENALTSYLLSVDQNNPGLLLEGNQELRDKLQMHISMLQNANQREHFIKVKLHRTEISNYRKQNGRCIITFQSAVQYFYTLEADSGEVIKGSKEQYMQAKYNTDAVYIQDRDLLEDERDLSLGINCPNCGAPVSGLGNKVCEYCQTPVIELNIYAWSFNNVEQVQ